MLTDADDEVAGDADIERAVLAAGGSFSGAIALGAGVAYLGVARLWWNRIAAANQRRMRAVADEVAALLERG